MIKEKEIQLKERLKNIIREIGHMNDVKQEIGNEFKSRNLSSFRASFVMSENLDLQTLSDSDEDIKFLFLFSYALNKALKGKTEIKINVEDYFTKVEIDKWVDYKEDIKEETIFPYIIEDVSELGENIWQTIFSAQMVDHLQENNILLYNFKTQRNPIITAAGIKINMDKDKIKQMTERMVKGEQYPSPIRLNLLKTGETPRPIYNKKNRTLTVLEGSIFNIFDGYHNKTAISLALEINPELKYNCPVFFTHMTEKEAHDFMAQIDKQKPIKKEYIQQMDYSKVENLVIEAIIDDKLSELAKIMKDDDSYIRLNKALTKKSIIAMAIRENYNEQLKLSTNIRSIARWIVEFTDYLIGSYTEEFIINPYEIKKTSLINHKNMFYGYIALSAKLQDNKEWKTLLKEKIESIDFNENHQVWKDFGVGINNLGESNKTTRNKLYNLFKEGVL